MATKSHEPRTTIKAQCRSLPEDTPACRIHDRPEEYDVRHQTKAQDGRFRGELGAH